jgi:uncharacterized protein (DUF1778 family)
MNFRLAAEIKARVVRAAAITGQGLTDFAAAALSEKADEILERHTSIALDADEYDFFLSVMSESRKPSARSRAAAARYKRGRRRGVRQHFDN